MFGGGGLAVRTTQRGVPSKQKQVGLLLRTGNVFTYPRTAQHHLKKCKKIAAIHSNRTTLTLTLNPKLKINPFLTLTLKRRWAVRGFVITRTGRPIVSRLLKVEFKFTSWMDRQPLGPTQ